MERYVVSGKFSFKKYWFWEFVEMENPILKIHTGIVFEHKFQSFSEIMDFMREYKIDSLYVRDCEKTTKWRKLTRTVKGD